MAGGIDKKKMFSKARPDMEGLSLLDKMGNRKDDFILRMVADQLEKEGFQVFPLNGFSPFSVSPSGGFD